jgi:hypothetical protein
MINQKNMSLRYSLLLFIWWGIFTSVNFIKAQSLSPVLIYSAGQKSTNAQFGSLDYAIGETVVAPTSVNSGQNLTLTQGYYQVYVISVTTDTEDGEHIEFATEIFPNPTSQYVIIKSELPVIYQLSDLQGRRMTNLDLPETNHYINVENLNEGIYILEISNSENRIKKSFKICISKP